MKKKNTTNVTAYSSEVKTCRRCTFAESKQPLQRMLRPDRLDTDRWVASFQHCGQRHVFSILYYAEINTSRLVKMQLLRAVESDTWLLESAPWTENCSRSGRMEAEG